MIIFCYIFCIVVISCIIGIIIGGIYSIMTGKDFTTDSDVSMVCFASWIVTGLILGIIVIIAETNKDDTITEEIDGHYYKNAYIETKDVDIDITATVNDGMVKRTSTYKLKGSDFNKDELKKTSDGFVDVITNMLKNREHAIDSINAYYKSNAQYNTANCVLRTENNKDYWICPAKR